MPPDKQKERGMLFEEVLFMTGFAAGFSIGFMVFILDTVIQDFKEMNRKD